jgi:DNA (cytosine-5)-methyltransferase 1
LLKKNTTIEEARQMGAGNGGKLNPTWVEWLMGWPLGWTDLKPLEMDKFQKWLEQHGA